MRKRTADDLQRYFYSQCLAVKLSFPSKHPAQRLQIPELYDKVKKLQIPLDQWPGFIRREFAKFQ